MNPIEARLRYVCWINDLKPGDPVDLVLLDKLNHNLVEVRAGFHVTCVTCNYLTFDRGAIRHLATSGIQDPAGRVWWNDTAPVIPVIVPPGHLPTIHSTWGFIYTLPGGT